MSQAEIKNHFMQNASIDDYDQKDKQEKLIEQLLKKVGKLSNQYIKLAKVVKNTDYIRGYNTSVSQSQLRELEYIRDKFDNGSNINSSSESDVLRNVKEATQEIESVLTQNGNSLSINDIIKYVKEKFYEVYASNKEELESQNRVALEDKSNIKNYKEISELDDVKGKLDFQTAMDDLTRNYAWIKDKSIRSLDSLNKKYQQIQADITELNTRLASYSIIDTVSQKKQRIFGQKINPLKDAEKKVIFDVLEDVFGLVGYTNDSVNVTLENCVEDINTLKESITEYHDLLEDKIKKLPNMISSSNLKKPKKGDELYELYLADPEKSERSEESRHEEKKEMRKEIKKLTSEVSQWKKAHKNLFDILNENQKLYGKIMKTKNAGPDSVNMLKELFKKSNLRLKELLRSQYKLHYTKQKKPKSHRNIPEHYEYTMSPKNDSRSQALLKTENQPEENQYLTDDLVGRINELRNEIKDLKAYKQNSEADIKDFETFKARHSLLKQEYEDIKRKYDQLKLQSENKDKSITELTRNNSRLSEQLSSLKNENKSLEDILDKNRTTEIQTLSEYRNTLNRSKKS
jgi:hypothetical protein